MLCCLNDWLILVESVPCQLEHGSSLTFVKTWGIVISLEKSDFKATNRAHYLGMLIDIIWEIAYPTDSLISRFQDVADKFLLHPYLPAKMWQQIFSLIAHSEQFDLRSRARMCPLQWQVKTHWSASSDDPAMPIYVGVPFVSDGDYRKENGVVRSQSKCPFYLLYTDALTGWGAHLWDLSVVRTWSAEEKNLHTSVLEMKANSVGSGCLQGQGHGRASSSHEQQCHSYGLPEEAGGNCVSRHVQTRPRDSGMVGHLVVHRLDLQARNF